MDLLSGGHAKAVTDRLVEASGRGQAVSAKYGLNGCVWSVVGFVFSFLPVHVFIT